ncbi:hypothetical protein [Nonomuraea glycinis]
MSALIGTAIGVLTYWAGFPGPASIAAGMAVTGSAVLGLDAIIG